MKELIHELTALLGENQVLVGEAVRQRPTSWFDNTPNGAGAIIRPGSTEEVAEALKLCAQAGTQVVPMGGMTGFVKGAGAGAHQIGLSLERMTGVEAVDTENRTVIVEAGAPLQSVQEAVESQGLHFPVDLGARGSCSIGGMVSTNAGGNEVLRYGMMREQILGLEAVLADGRVLSNLRPLMKNNTGYDLKQLFIGSEGTLGIVTRVVLKLRPLHQAQSTAWVAVDDNDHLATLLQFLERALGGRLSAFEVMWRDHYQLMLAGNKHQPPLEPKHPYFVLLQAANYHDSEYKVFDEALEQAFERGYIADAAVATSKAQQAKMWAIRDDIEGLTQAMAPYAAYDVSLPLPNMQGYINTLDEGLKGRWPEAKLIVFGHLGDGNLHLFVNIGDSLSEAQKNEINDMVYTPLRALNGSISAEHGIGFDKKPYLHLSRSEAELSVMRQLKQVLDPGGLLNPGAIFDQ